MKKKTLLLSISILFFLAMMLLVSCRAKGPDISDPSVHYNSTFTEAELWWDYEAFTAPFVLSVKETTEASMTDISVPVPPHKMAVERGKSYEWKVLGNNGATGGPWAFTVP